MAVLLGNCIADDHELTQVTSKHCHMLFATLALTINVDQIVHENVLHWGDLLHELSLDLRVEALNLLPLALSFSLTLTLLLSSNLGLVSLVLCLFDVLQFLNVFIDFLDVLGACVVDVSRDQSVRVTFKVFYLFDKVLSLTHEPRQDILTHSHFLEFILEEADVLQKHVSVTTDVSRVRLCNLTANYLLVGNLPCSSSVLLEILLRLVLVEAFLFLLLHLLNFGLFIHGEVVEVHLLAVHLCELFFLQHFHSCDF